MVSVQRATIELWMHFGGLPSTQEASFLSRLGKASFVLSSLPRAFKGRDHTMRQIAVTRRRDRLLQQIASCDM